MVQDFFFLIYRTKTKWKKTRHALSKCSTLHNASLHLHSYLNTITLVHFAGAEPSTKRSVTRTAASVGVVGYFFCEEMLLSTAQSEEGLLYS